MSLLKCLSKKNYIYENYMWPWTTKPVIRFKFFEIEIYASSESWINKLSTDVWFDRTIFAAIQLFENGIWGCKKNLNIEKISFKVVQMKFLALHITNKKFSFEIFMAGIYKISSWNMILLNIVMIFGIKDKNYNLDAYSVLLAIATNIPVQFILVLLSRSADHTHTHTHHTHTHTQHMLVFVVYGDSP